MLVIIELTKGETTYHLENTVTPIINEWYCDGEYISSYSAHKLINNLKEKGFVMTIEEH